MHRSRLISALCLGIVLTATASTLAASPPQEAEPSPLQKLMQEVLEYRRADNKLPLPTGVDERYADRFDAVSIDAFEAEREQLQEFLERLQSLGGESLERQAGIDAEILRLQLRDRINELTYRAYLLPLGSRSGFHFGFASAPESWTFDDVETYDRYIARMQSFRTHTLQQIELMRTALAEGFAMPSQVLVGYEQTAGQHVVEDPTASGFYAPLRELPESFAPADRERIRADGLAAIRDSVLPAYAELRDFFATEYLPGARSGLGLVDLPDGRAFYEHRVRRYTTLDLTPEQVHEVGLEQVASIRAEMDAIRAEVGFAGSHLDFVEYLRTEPRFYVDSSDAYLAVVALAAKRMEGHLPRLFGTLPLTPYGVRAMPAHVAPRQSAGYYDRGNADGTAAGWVNINTSLLHTRPTWVGPALAFHEGVPGHHLQIMLASENDAISEFRRRSSTTVFVEGWGLYAERLGLDVGLYDDPYDRFGMWSYQIWRACRLVVDTGMHALGWERDRAIAFMAENTGMAVEAVTAEIDRHITEPGQGLAYTMGELEISALRQRAAATLGDAFDLRAFHDVVLGNGALPLSILRAEVHRWIEEQAAAR